MRGCGGVRWRWRGGRCGRCVCVCGGVGEGLGVGELWGVSGLGNGGYIAIANQPFFFFFFLFEVLRGVAYFCLALCNGRLVFFLFFVGAGAERCLSSFLSFFSRG